MNSTFHQCSVFNSRPGRSARSPRLRGSGSSLLLAAVALALGLVAGLSQTARPAAEEVLQRELPGQMYEQQGQVRYKPASGGETNAVLPQPVGFNDALRTLDLSGAAMRLSDQSQLRLKERTRLEIRPQPGLTNSPVLRIHQGQAYFINRGRVAIPTETPHARGVPRGTEFLVEVDPDSNQTAFTMFDGEVELTSPADPLPVPVRSGQQGIVVAGQPTRIVPILQATNIVQWWNYYPGILDPEELGLSDAARFSLAESLVKYRAGDVIGALGRFPGYPQPMNPSSDEERIYLSQLFLAVGAVDRADAQLSAANTNAPLAGALRMVIHAVSRDFSSAMAGPTQLKAPMGAEYPSTASECLARSYRSQAEHDLAAALASARAAVQRSPGFGFGWARVAELEFSFAHVTAAREALGKALALAPRNAQARALNGFLLAADNRISGAIAEFDQAIALDPALGNAWLGRGLSKRRLGMFAKTDWLADLQAAATLEPQRSLTRSYVGKAFSDVSDAHRATKELAFARELDPNDPTGWLYGALEEYLENRPNEAVNDLERSVKLNDNRAVYRSQLLLDEDRAVRSSSLAKIYQDAGLSDFSLNEAARAVSFDYANHSAHQFLAESYNALRDPTRFNLRYETIWFNELLLANLLSPVGSGVLSQNISQQEYSKLFEADRLGFLTSTEYRSDGQVRETASQFGRLKDFSYSLDLDYQHNDGVRVNNDLNRIEWYSQLKYQLTPQDSVFLLVKYEDYSSGDNFQYYNPTNARPNYRLTENQAPLLVGAWHHEWSPGIHTTAMIGRLDNQQAASDRQAPETILEQDPSGAIVSGFSHANFDVDYQSQFTTWLGEINQIIQNPWSTLVFGAQAQQGEFNTHATVFNPPAEFTNYFLNPPSDETIHEGFSRISGYAYETLHLWDALDLTVGLNYDTITYPAQFRSPPIAPGEAHRDLLSPKLAAVWTPWNGITFRGAYARSLGGASFDESFRLEPAQLAGFVQSFRSIISESLVGIQSVPEFKIRGLGMDWRLPRQTYFSLQAEWLSSDVSGPVGVFYDEFLLGTQPEVFPGSLKRSHDYEERSVAASLTKLIGEYWSIGLTYRFTASELRTVFPQVPLSIDPNADLTQSANLHQLSSFLQFTSPSGFFARAEAEWFHQSNDGYSGDEPGDSFTQVNVFAGWRFLRRRAEVTLGLLNLSGTDYHLNPLTPYSELPRERVFLARLRFEL